MSKIPELVQLIKQSKRMLILTGAGMSTESGLADYRGMNGMWKDHKCAELMTPKGLHTNPEAYTEFVKWRVQNVMAHGPNEGHQAIAALQGMYGEKVYLATQNVDGYHLAAGSPQVNELHGRLLNMYCSACGHPTTPEEYMKDKGEICKQCTYYIRPGVVMFTENLPDSLQEARDFARASDLVIACGTSLQVYPAAHLFLDSAVDRVIINRGETALDHNADMIIDAGLGETWTEILRQLHG